MKRAADILVFAVISLFVLAACTSEPETIEVTRVVTEVSEVEVEVTREVDEPEDEIVSDGVWCNAGLSSDFLKGDGNHRYITWNLVGDWTGVFTGTSEEYSMEIVNLHSSPRAIWIGTVLFDTVDVDGTSGGLEMYITAEVAESGDDGKGTWAITEGTGELENLQGHGTWWGQGWQGNYSACGEVDYSVEELIFQSD
jgi:hypothetical protein